MVLSNFRVFLEGTFFVFVCFLIALSSIWFNKYLLAIAFLSFFFFETFIHLFYLERLKQSGKRRDRCLPSVGLLLEYLQQRELG